VPAYDHKCTVCGTVFEVVRPMGATTQECCPECGGEARRVFGSVGVAFKGSGFHNTDYKSRPAETSAPSEAPACATPSCPST